MVFTHPRKIKSKDSQLFYGELLNKANNVNNNNYLLQCGRPNAEWNHLRHKTAHCGGNFFQII